MGNKKHKKKHKVYKKRTDLKSALQSIYHDTVSLKTNCCHSCTCCKVAMPQINYSEFINIASRIWGDKEFDKVELICKSVEYFFRNEYEKWGMDSLVKPCMFLGEDNRCKIYEERPLNCFLPDTWVFTNYGPKRIKNVMAGDKVYGQDGNLHTVTATRSMYKEEDIFNIKTQGNCFDNWCTGDHKWLSTKQKDKRKKPNAEWVEAKTLVAKKCKQEGNYAAFPIKWEDKTGSTTIDVTEYVDGICDESYIAPFTSGKIFEGHNPHRIPKEIIVDNEFLFMLGIYLAEGSCSEQSVSFSMNISEKCHLDRIARYLEGCIGVPTHYNKVKKGKNVIVLRVDSCLFARLMKVLGGKLSYGKRIHEDLFKSLRHSQLMMLFESWNVGDGRKCFREKEYSVTTASEELSVQMQMILLMNGIYPQVYKCDKGLRRTNYDVHVFPSNFRDCNDGQGTKLMYDDSYVYNPLYDIDKEMYFGPVIDIQVEDVESFITPSGIAHNCRLYGLWPEEVYNRRVEKFVKAYEPYGLSKEEIPLSSQCPNVKRTDESIELTEEVIESLFDQIDDVDKTIGEFSTLQIKQKENYRTFHDWLLLKVFQENWLAMLTSFILAATREKMEDQIEQIKAVVREKYTDKLPDLEKVL